MSKRILSSKEKKKNLEQQRSIVATLKMKKEATKKAYNYEVKRLNNMEYRYRKGKAGEIKLWD